MKITKLLPSINIAFNLNSDYISEIYIPSQSHINFLNTALSGTLKNTSVRSHILVGPYGSGKSLITTLTLSFVSGKLSKESYERIVNKFKKEENFQEVIALLEGLNKNKRKIIPVVVTDDGFGLSSSIIKAVEDKLKSEKIKITFSDVSSEIFETVELWKTKYPTTFQNFKEKILSDKKITLEQWLNLSLNDRKEAAWFEEIFKELTSGSQIRLKTNISASKFLEKVAEDLNKLELGLFIVFDEFGRHLQALKFEEINRTMSEMQDLAELSNNGTTNVSVCFITHKTIDSYFTKFGDELKSEFNKISNRFIIHSLKSDPQIQIKVINNHLINTLGNLLLDVKNEGIEEKLMSFRLFEELSYKEIKNYIAPISGLIHPVALYFLIQISSNFGQNERSLFTFINNEKILKEKIESLKSISFSDVFDYFFFSGLDVFQQNKISKIFLERLNKLNDNLEISIFKFIFTADQLNLKAKFPINDKLLGFAFDKNINIIAEKITKLVENNFLRKNFKEGSLEINLSSGIDIDGLIKESISKNSVKTSDLLDSLNKISEIYYIRPLNYNLKYKITRYATVKFVLAEEIKEIKNSDATINIVLVDNSKINKTVKELVKRELRSNTFLAIASINLNRMLELLEKYQAASSLIKEIKNKHQAIEYYDDLMYYLEQTENSIKMEFNEVLKIDRDLKWIVNKEFIKIDNKKDFTNFIEAFFFDKTGKTIPINNDGINKSKITPVQAKNLVKLGQNLLELKTPEGNGPDFLSYQTIFVNNGIEVVKNFFASNKEYGRYNSLRKNLIKLIEDNYYLDDIINFVCNFENGYALRRPLIPIILIGVLRDVWENIVFETNGSYVNNLNSEFFNRICTDNLNRYKVSIIKYTDKQIELINNVLNLYKDYDLNKFLPLHERAVVSMRNWLNGLSKFTKISNSISKKAVIFRDIIFKSEFQPLISIDDLTNFKELDEIKSELDKFDSKMLSEMGVYILSLFKANNLNELKNSISLFSKPMVKNNKLLNSIRLGEDMDEVSSILINKITELQIKDLSDTLFEMLQGQIDKHYKNALSGDYESDSINKITLNGDEFVVNKVESTTTGINLKERLNGLIQAKNLRVSKEEVVDILINIIKERAENIDD
jgi:hypothetical protein